VGVKGIAGDSPVSLSVTNESEYDELDEEVLNASELLIAIEIRNPTRKMTAPSIPINTQKGLPTGASSRGGGIVQFSFLLPNVHLSCIKAQVSFSFKKGHLKGRFFRTGVLQKIIGTHVVIEIGENDRSREK
jgi:hypothetical protein